MRRSGRKRGFSVFLACVLIMASVIASPLRASAEEVIMKSSKIIGSWDAGDMGDNIKATLFEKADGTYHLQFEGKGDMYKYAPDSAPWQGRDYRGKITSASVLEGITSLGNYTLNIKALKKVELPEGLERIGYCALGSYSYGAPGINYIRIPSTVKTIEGEAFCNVSFTRLTLPASLESVHGEAFNGWGVGIGGSVADEVYYPGTRDEYEAISFGSVTRLVKTDSVHFGQTDPNYDNYTLTKYVLDDTPAAPSTPQTPDAPSAPATLTTFVDVESNSYYADAVKWAVEQNITTGTGNGLFSPKDICTRAQVVTFLWRQQGSAQASSSGSFGDVNSGEYFSTAVNWAVSQNITTGTSGNMFSPGKTCTRAEVVTFLWRAAGSPSTSTGNVFSDVQSGSYYDQAVRWAVDKGITKGTGGGMFSPGNACTRAEIVTFLYKYAQG